MMLKRSRAGRTSEKVFPQEAAAHRRDEPWEGRRVGNMMLKRSRAGRTSEKVFPQEAAAHRRDEPWEAAAHRKG